MTQAILSTGPATITGQPLPSAGAPAPAAAPQAAPASAAPQAAPSSDGSSFQGNTGVVGPVVTAAPAGAASVATTQQAYSSSAPVVAATPAAAPAAAPAASPVPYADAPPAAAAPAPAAAPQVPATAAALPVATAADVASAAPTTAVVPADVAAQAIDSANQEAVEASKRAAHATAAAVNAEQAKTEETANTKTADSATAAMRISGLLVAASHWQNIGLGILHDAGPELLPLLKNNDFKNSFLEAAERAGGPDGRKLAEESVKAFVKSGGSFSEGGNAFTRTFLRLRGVTNPRTPLFHTGTKVSNAKALTKAGAKLSDSQLAKLKTSATKLSKEGEALKAPAKTAAEMSRRGAALGEHVGAKLPAGSGKVAGKISANKLLGGVSVAFATGGFLKTLSDPNSTMFSKVLHGAHVVTSAVGLIDPALNYVGLIGDVATLGADMAGLTKDKGAKIDPSTVDGTDATGAKPAASSSSNGLDIGGIINGLMKVL